MTDPGIYYPDKLSPAQLDTFLAKGWYRMGQGIFTTNYILQEGKFYRVYWLRYNLLTWSMSKSSQKIWNANKRFTTEIVPLQITEELEELYTLYKTSLDFEPASSVASWLFDQHLSNVYDSWLVEVRDEGRLIAAGIFDKSKKSIAGILNFYNPSYGKSSPGKYLMLVKICAAKERKVLWYYPGYIVNGYPKFDYKLFAGKENSEIYIPELNEWRFYDPALLESVGNIETSEEPGELS